MKMLKQLIAIAAIATIVCSYSCKNTNFLEPDIPLAEQRDARNANPDSTYLPSLPIDTIAYSLIDEPFLVSPQVRDTLRDGLILKLISENNIACKNAYFALNNFRGEGISFDIWLGKLIFLDHCTENDRKAQNEILLHPIDQGRSVFRITIGEKRFEGAIIRNGNEVIFEWPDESQFKFTKKSFYL